MGSESANTSLAFAPSDLVSPLRQMFGCDDVAVVEWHQEMPSGAVGTSGGAVARVTGTAVVDGISHVWSLICKWLARPQSGPADASNRLETPSGINYWKREFSIYQSKLLDELPDALTVPRCYQAVEKPDGCILWLEEVQDETALWALDRYGLAAQSLGLFNGRYLTELTLPDYPWLSVDIDQQRMQRNRETWAKLDELRQQPIVRRGWPDDVAAGILRIWHERESFFRSLGHLPSVFQHGDAGRRNLMSRQGQKGELETVAIDWGYTGVGAVGAEIGPLVVSSAIWFQGVVPAQLPELEEAIFEGYLQGLRQAGWRGDPQLVRLGYLCTVALRFGIGLAIPEVLALAQESGPSMKDLFGWTIEEWSDVLVQIRRFVIQRADEARQLMANT